MGLFTPGRDRYSEEEVARALKKQEIYNKFRDQAEKKRFKLEAQYKYGLKKRPQRQGFLSKLQGQVQQVSRTLPQQRQSQGQAQGQTQYQQVFIEQRRKQQEQQKQPSFEPPNFFAHKDEVEVYGDEGLTFFDSNKKRGGGRTGSLFGI